MQKVKIITHSGCDLSYQEAEKYNITMVPDWVIFDNHEFRNNIDIHPEAFYERLSQNDTLPTSSHPSPSEFMDAFRCAADYEDIIFIALSSKLTGTYNTAMIAAQTLEDEDFPSRIHVFDSTQASYGAAIIILEAAKLASSGCTAQEILSELDKLVPQIGVYFIMDTLKYAYKGGRIGAIRAITADALGIKPLLVFQDGTVSDLSINRTFNEGLKSVFKRFKYFSVVNEDVIIFHACNEKGANKLKSMIQKEYPHIEPRMELIGPVIGLYAGPGCVGIAFKKKEL